MGSTTKAHWKVLGETQEFSFEDASQVILQQAAQDILGDLAQANLDKTELGTSGRELERSLKKAGFQMMSC